MDATALLIVILVVIFALVVWSRRQPESMEASGETESRRDEGTSTATPPPKRTSSVASKSSTGQWEYRDYIRKLPSNPPLEFLDGTASITEVRKEAWLQARSAVLEDIQKWRDEGWEPTVEVGPDCWQFRTVRRSRAYRWTAFQWVAFLFMFLAIIPILFLFQMEDWIVLDEFRVPMRRQLR